MNFDFSGCGESDDDSLTVDKQVDDLQSAISYVESKGLKRIGLLGLSLGSLISLKVCDERIKTMVLWAPVTEKIKYSREQRYSAEQLQELKEKGHITKTRDKGVRKKIIIDRQMLKDGEQVDQKPLCSRIECPVLVIHGDKDDRVPLQDSENAMKYLSKESRLEIIAGADHDFTEQLDQFIELSVSWFNRHLAQK